MARDVRKKYKWSLCQ